MLREQWASQNHDQNNVRDELSNEQEDEQDHGEDKEDKGQEQYVQCLNEFS